MNRQLQKPALVFTLLALILNSQTYADEQVNVDTNNWLCNFCNYPRGWFGQLGMGPGYATDASLKFADYRGITDKGGFVAINGDIHYLDAGGRYFDLYARDLGISSRQLDMRGGRQGRIEWRLSYREIPKYRGYGTATPFRGSAPDQLGLPSDWFHARTTGGMSALDFSLNPVTLETKRKIFEAGLSFAMSGNWRYEADFQHTQKNGSRALGAGVSTNQSSHFPAPVDFSINRFDMGLEYASDLSRVRFGFSGSRFKNQYRSVTWENPFIPLGNTALLRTSLEPDSNFYQFNLVGSHRLNGSVRFSGQASFGRITQDSNFVAYSINPDFNDIEPPTKSLSGDLETTSLAARMSARFSPKFNLFLNFKYNDRDNRTPLNVYTPVITDLYLRPETSNRPYSFKRKQYSAEFTYRTYVSINFNAGARQKDYKRTLQSVRETRDSTWWGEVSFDHWSIAQLRFRLELSDREMSPYIQVSDPGLQENILMRKFHLASRDRDRAVFELDLSTGDRLSASLSYFVARDSYKQSVLGLMESNENSLSLDLGFSVKTNLNLHAFVNIDDYQSDISSTAHASNSGWMANTKDRFTTWGFGLNGQLNDRINMTIDYVSSDSRGRIATYTSANEPAFPDLTTSLRHAKIHLNYKANKQWGISLQAEHENYDSLDWQIDELGNDGISAILTLGPFSPDYSITLFRLLAIYNF